MIIQKGRGTYAYRTERVNGKPVTRYIGKSTSPQARAHEKNQEEKKQHRQREIEITQLDRELESVLRKVKIMERGFLLVAGFYTRKSEIRPLPLQEDYYAP